MSIVCLTTFQTLYKPFKRYEPRAILGVGGFGAVFHCHDRFARTDVAIKTLLDGDLDRDLETVFAEAHILRELDHKALREYKRKALHFHLDTRRPEIVRPDQGQAAPGRRASLADTVREKLRSRVLTENIDREALVELGLHYLHEADLVAGPATEEATA